MLTRCPSCETTFRVTPDQLKARQGRVRCGECRAVFNALDTLVDATPAAASAEIARHDDRAALVPESTAVDTHQLPLPEPAAPDDDLPAAASDASPPAESDSEPDTATPVEVEVPADDSADFEPMLHELPQRRRWPWALGSLLVLCVLMTQAALHFRTEIAVLHPEVKSLLESACVAMGCELRLPRKAEFVSIEASDLHPDADAKLTLTATLKNRAPFVQEYPHLEISLTDTADQPLARRVLAPADYLPPKTVVSAGFPANGDLALTLGIEATGIAAVGYRLYLFYP